MRFGISQNLFVDDDPEAMARSWLAIQQAHLAYWIEQDMRETPAEIAARLERQLLRAFCRPGGRGRAGRPGAHRLTSDALAQRTSVPGFMMPAGSSARFTACSSG
jgi:hypothetical protein